MGLTLRLAKRNIALYFRDPMSVFFSVLGALIVLLLYVLFLGNIQVRELSASMPQASLSDIEFFVNSWVMGGILSISTLTTSLGAMGIMVDDQHLGILKDFRVAPVKRWQLVMGYLLSAALSSLIINIVLFAAAEGLIVLRGGTLLGVMDALKVLGLLLLCCVSFTAISAFFVSLVKTPGAYGSLSSIIGTLLGFLSGAYIPIGSYTDTVQTFVKLLPFSHAGALLRSLFLGEPIRRILQGVPSDITNEVLTVLGVNMAVNGYVLSPTVMLATISGFGLIFFVLSVWRMSRSKEL